MVSVTGAALLVARHLQLAMLLHGMCIKFNLSLEGLGLAWPLDGVLMLQPM